MPLTVRGSASSRMRAPPDRSVEPDPAEHHCCRREGCSVRECRRPRAIRSNVLRHEPGGEGDERDTQEQENVQQEEGAIDLADLIHQRVMVHPDDADRQEADGVPDVRGPDVQQLSREASPAAFDLRVDVEDEQRRSDCNDTVSEGLQPTATHRALGELERGVDDPPGALFLAQHAFNDQARAQRQPGDLPAPKPARGHQPGPVG